ncbi:MAG: dockerin type I repeat-containing protein [Prevotella sp.]|nr:dockerin type I repeat-containing protein [Prevotella sp.]
MKQLKILTGLLVAMLAAQPMAATDYLTFLTPDRGFTEVTTFDGFITEDTYYYLIAPDEDHSLMVGIGTYEAKPSWAGTDTKALRYVTASEQQLLRTSNYFTIENSGPYIGLRNVVYASDLMQTHNDAGFMYVNTFTDPSLDEWSYLTPSYQDGYWLLESGKYPLSGGNYYSGYLGPWNKIVAVGEAIALNRKNTTDDEAGHYRFFRIKKSDYLKLTRQLLQTANSSTPVDATGLINNPSFETGDGTGWTFIGKNADNTEFAVRSDYTMTGKEGHFLFNAYQWWAENIAISQTVENVPSGIYELKAVVATWENREVYATVNGTTVTAAGRGADEGIEVTIPLNVGSNRLLSISIGSTGQWWLEGHKDETQTFFKADDIRLTCQGVYLDGMAVPLPNDNVTPLAAGQWYYYDAAYHTQYLLRGNITDMVYSTDGTRFSTDITTQPVERHLTFDAGRVYFKTTQTGATLSIEAEKEVEESTFTAVALNVDGLPQKVAFVTINEDGPGSDGTKLISQYLKAKDYDFIGVSEDFNYHGSLMSELDDDDYYSSGTVRATLSLTDLSIPFDTDGLNLIWKNSTCSASNESWMRWKETTSTDGNQYVKKGYRHYDMTLANGCVFDVYVLHMDAGDAISSREKQWKQLAEAINTATADRPKLVLGDTNSRWTREEIHANFFSLLSNYNVSDTWVELCRNNQYPNTSMGDLTNQTDPANFANYEVVDKIIYLNPKTSNTLQLKPLSFKLEQDYTYGTVEGTNNTKALGDHRPVVVEFNCLKAGNNKHLMGDVNRDGVINVSDVTAAVNIILSEGNLSPDLYDFVAADVNLDGPISVSDVTALVNIILSEGN